VTLPLTDDDAATGGGSCCGTAPATEVPVEVDAGHAAWANGEARVGFATGVEGGRAADTDGGALPLAEVRGRAGGSCCG
jgi:hypothetical protein